VFLVGVRNDLPNTFRFPIGFRLDKRLKDILEPIVDEKYYLSEKMVTGFISRKENGSGFAKQFSISCITTSPPGQPQSNYIQDGYINQDTQASAVYSTNGTSPTVCAGTHGYAMGYIQDPYCVAMRGRSPENSSDRTTGVHTEQRLEKNSQGVTNTITSVQKDNLIVGPVLIEHRGHLNKEPVFILNGIVPTLRAESHGHETKVILHQRIRRLTPLECFRLQGYPDEYIKPCSDSQTYKQAGNSITVNVMEAIVKNILPILK